MAALARRRDPARAAAAAAGYVARSALKLEWLLGKAPALAPRGGAVLDLGSAPGAWLQVVCRKGLGDGRGGAVVGVDLAPFPVPRRHCDGRARAVVGDALRLTPAGVREMVGTQGGATGGGGANAPPSPPLLFFDSVLSDMCHPTTGIASVDVVRSAALAAAAARLAVGREDASDGDSPLALPLGFTTPWPPGDRLLAPVGAFAAKLLDGGAPTAALVASLTPFFARVRLLRPPATRTASREVYIVGEGFVV
jgi:23S rRNA U2552 (ribose-2'-O)-methylase RlmE/FtsJ